MERIGKEQMDLWTLTVSQGFSENFPVTQEILEVMKMFALGANVECYLARVDGAVAGGATLALREGVAGLFGASTLPAFRNRGVQTALLKERLRRAMDGELRLGGVYRSAGKHLAAQCGAAGLFGAVHAGEIRAGLVLRALRDALVDEVDDVLRGSAGEKYFGDAGFLEVGDVGFGNNAAEKYGDVGHAFVVQQLHELGTDGVVGTGEDGEADDVDVLLHGGGRDHLGRLAEPGIDHFHAGVAQRASDHLRAAVVTVQPGLGNQHSDFLLRHYSRFSIWLEVQEH